MIKEPSPNTLKRYGLSLEEWLSILKKQGNVCAICKKEPPSGRLVTDHFHAPLWKKMPPDKRKIYVRGILCWTCNHYYVGRAITVFKAENVVVYLKEFEERKKVLEEKIK